MITVKRKVTCKMPASHEAIDHLSGGFLPPPVRAAVRGRQQEAGLGLEPSFPSYFFFFRAPALPGCSCAGAPKERMSRCSETPHANQSPCKLFPTLDPAAFLPPAFSLLRQCLLKAWTVRSWKEFLHLFLLPLLVLHAATD